MEFTNQRMTFVLMLNMQCMPPYIKLKFKQKLDKLLSLSDLDWKKKYYVYRNKIMKYSYKNSLLNKTIKEILNEK